MPQRIVIIGAVALGPKAACRFKRIEPESEVTMIDQSSIISYGGCGIPYFVSGDVSDPQALQSTSFNMLRDENFFREAKDIRVLINTRATSIDRVGKQVLIRDLSTRQESVLDYDKLVLASGSSPRTLNVPGAGLEGLFTISNMDQAIAIKDKISKGEVEKAVIIGAGAIGLEMAEALSDLWGIETTVVEIQDQLLPGVIGSNLAGMAQTHMEQNGLVFHFSEQVLEFKGDRKLEAVVTDKRELKADLAIIAAGVRPNAELARGAGLEISPSGAIVVDRYLRTSDPDIYSGGDCVEVTNLVTGRPGYFPLGSMANRQGRVIGTNLAGGRAEFEGAVGSFAVKLFDISLAGAGLCRKKALEHGFKPVSAFVVQFDRAHFYPDKDLMYLELIVDKDSKRVLGIQGLGNKGDGLVGRVDAVASILKYCPRVEEISNLELAYSPPFSAAMDILNALGNTAENILEGKNRVIDVNEFARAWQQKDKEDIFFLDCRGWGNAEPLVKKYPDRWKSIPQDELRSRLSEVPADKEIVLICNTGVRSYEAQITLDKAGIKKSRNLQGGMAALKKWGLDI